MNIFRHYAITNFVINVFIITGNGEGTGRIGGCCGILWYNKRCGSVHCGFILVSIESMVLKRYLKGLREGGTKNQSICCQVFHQDIAYPTVKGCMAVVFPDILLCPISGSTV